MHRASPSCGMSSILVPGSAFASLSPQEITSLYRFARQSQVGRGVRGHPVPPPAQHTSTYTCTLGLWVQCLPKELARRNLYITHLKWGQIQHLGCSASRVDAPATRTWRALTCACSWLFPNTEQPSPQASLSPTKMLLKTSSHSAKQGDPDSPISVPHPLSTEAPHPEVGTCV